MSGLAILLACQLVGELVVRLLRLPLPGPVIGAVLLLVLLRIRPDLVGRLRPVGHGLLAHLSLLFVPAGTGVLVHLARVQAEWAPIVLALLLSTVLTIAVSATVFSAVARLRGDTVEQSA